MKNSEKMIRARSGFGTIGGGFKKALTLGIITLFFCSCVCLFNITSGVVAQNSFVSLDYQIIENYADGTTVDRGISGQPGICPSGNSTKPLTRDTTRLLDRDEIAIMSTSGHLDILDDSLCGFNNSKDIAVDMENVTTGNFDGDLQEEIVVLASNLVLTVYNINGSTIRALDLSLFGVHTFDAFVVAGDFEGDGADELAICFLDWHTSGGIKYDNYIRIWDVIDNTFQFDSSFDSQMYGWDAPVTDFVAGDFDKDGRDELAYVGLYRTGKILDVASSPFTVLKSFTQDGTDTDMFYYLAICDYDCDTYDDLVMMKTHTVGGGCQSLMVYDHASLFAGQIITPSLFTTDAYTWNDLDAGDLDGDGREEIVITGRNISAFPNTDYYLFVIDKSSAFSFQLVATPVLYAHASGPFLGLVKMGDLDSDGLSEVIVSGKSNNTMLILDDGKHQYATLLNNTNHQGRCVCGDFDNDGFILFYTGTSWKSVSGPDCAIVALAAPPTYTGITQNYAFSYTAYGEETSIGVGESSTVGCSSMVGLTFEQDFDKFGITYLSISFSKTLKHELSFTNNVVSTTSTAVSFASGTEENSVIYQRTSYDRYEYEILSHPYNSSLVGTCMTIDIPVNCLLYQTYQSYFNSHNSAPIGAETFSHTIGQPWTYPTWAEMDALAPAARGVSGETTVGLGTGVTSCTVQVGTESGSKMETTTQSEWSFGIGALGAEYVRSIGAFGGTAYEIVCGSSCSYEGCVGHIQNEAEWESLQYSYGLCVYSMTGPAGNSYQVVNYFVNGAIPYYPPNSPGNLAAIAFIAGLSLVGLAIVIRSNRKSHTTQQGSRTKSKSKAPGTTRAVKSRGKASKTIKP